VSEPKYRQYRKILIYIHLQELQKFVPPFVAILFRHLWSICSAICGNFVPAVVADFVTNDVCRSVGIPADEEMTPMFITLQPWSAGMPTLLFSTQKADFQPMLFEF
jgi:hypothetical protein